MTSSNPLTLLFFDDPRCGKFHPLTLTRPMIDLRVGILTIREKWVLTLNPGSVIEPSPTATGSGLSDGGSGLSDGGNGLPDAVKQGSGDYLIVNSRLLPGKKIVSALNSIEPGHALTADKAFLAGRLSGPALSAFIANRGQAAGEKHVAGPGQDAGTKPEAEPGQDAGKKQDTETGNESFSDSLLAQFDRSLPIPADGIRLLNSLPDLLAFNGSEIEADLVLKNMIKRGSGIRISPHALFTYENNIFIGDRSEIEPGAVLIAENGPVCIGNDVKIMAGAVIRGPVAIGDGSTIKAGAKIYEETTIGPVCKIAGEVQNAIFHSCSNKAHEGFVGNSLFGQWCNLGADTNTSNLKNNYSTVSLTDWESKTAWDTGRQFLGTIMADHSKTGINTMLNTGTICGVSCNIFGSDFPPKYIPSFSWVNGRTVEPYQVDKAIETMKRVMARRNVEMTGDYKEMMMRIAEGR